MGRLHGPKRRAWRVETSCRDSEGIPCVWGSRYKPGKSLLGVRLAHHVDTSYMEEAGCGGWLRPWRKGQPLLTTPRTDLSGAPSARQPSSDPRRDVWALSRLLLLLLPPPPTHPASHPNLPPSHPHSLTLCTESSQLPTVTMATLSHLATVTSDPFLQYRPPGVTVPRCSAGCMVMVDGVGYRMRGRGREGVGERATRTYGT